MHCFRVWAPNAKTVEVDTTNERTSMTCEEGGWWSADVSCAGPGTDYGFRVDGSDPLADPRSPWQPHGVHGLSRLVDHNTFPWTDQHWQSRPLSSAVLYEMHVGTFTPGGTFTSAIERLGHLVDLGVTHMEIMPVSEFPGPRGWGYDGVDLYAPYHAYGGPDGLKQLVNACHERGLGVILDVAYNHLGPAGNYLSRFGPYFTSRHMTPWGEAVNFDGPASDNVRRYIIDNALMWLRDYHFDGLRLDAVHQIMDNSATHILEQMTKEVEMLEAALGRHFIVIGESDLNNPRLVWAREIGGYNLQCQWNEDFHHALHSLLTGERSGYYVDFGGMGHLAKTLERGYAYDGCYSIYRQRAHGRPATGLPGERFLGYLQNHDQVGNRAAGERSSMLMNLGRLKVGAALVMTAPFVPMLFMGEEWAASTPFQYFASHEDPDLARAVSEGRRKEFGAFGWKPEEVPDPQDPETFRRSKLNWEELTDEPHASILRWHKQLIRLRRGSPHLNDGEIGEVRACYDEAGRWLRVERRCMTIACNLADQARCIPLDPQRSVNILLTSDPSVSIVNGGVQMPPDSVVILGPTG